MFFLNIMIYTVGAHIFFSVFCPNEYHVTLINMSFYIILTYSYVEIYAKKMYYHENMTQIRSFIENINKKNEIEIVKFNDVIVSTNKNSLRIHQLLLYDFIIYSDYSSAASPCSKINKVIYFGFPKFPINYSYNVCKFSFISINVKLIINCKEQSYQIKLSNETENYYIVGNKINKLVVSYMLKKQHGIMRDEVSEKYVLELIDQNVNMFSLSEKNEIVLNETEYKIVPFVFTDTSNMTVKEVEKLCNDNPSCDFNAESKSTKLTSESISE